MSEHDPWVRKWLLRGLFAYGALCLAIAGWLAYRTW
jgi:hypothetical protein